MLEAGTLSDELVLLLGIEHEIFTAVSGQDLWNATGSIIGKMDLLRLVSRLTRIPDTLVESQVHLSSRNDGKIRVFSPHTDSAIMEHGAFTTCSRA